MRSNVGMVLIFLCSMGWTDTKAQPVREPDGGGYRTAEEVADEFSASDYGVMRKQLAINKLALQKSGAWSQPLQQSTSFIWPTRLKPGLAEGTSSNLMGFYAISNFVDQNIAFPNKLLDYQCGQRTYDVSGGYNHRGTDIFSWPFSWYKMQHNQVEIIAAAAGTIVAKFDGNFDRNCSFCTSACDWNAVYVRHADGSIAWYGHLKSGSLTTKALGATVAAGEYLGVMGSSGNSTGPHLHFEVWTDETLTQLVEPWGGPCNLLNGTTSWWASQQPYRVSGINALMTHSAAPVITQCPNGERVNESKSFAPGSRVFVGSYYRDQLGGKQALHELYMPNNTRFSFWQQNLTDTFSASWWWYGVTLPFNAMQGLWRYEVTYDGKLYRTVFAVGSSLQYRFTGNGAMDQATNWEGGLMPDMPVPAGVEVVIATTGTHECVVNSPVIFLRGSRLTIENNSRVRFQHNLQFQ